MPDTYGDMVQCENCHKWFHIKCVGLLTLPNWDGFCGEGTASASRTFPPGQNPLADSVRGDSFLEGGPNPL